MAFSGNRVILCLSRSLALCKLGELVALLLLTELPDEFLGFGEEELDGCFRVADPLVGVACVAPPIAAFKVLSNICNSFMVSGPNFEGSLPNAANGANNEDIAAAAAAFLDKGVAGPKEFAPGVELGGAGGPLAGGMNRPGDNIANKLCCCAGVIFIGFIAANAANC